MISKRSEKFTLSEQTIDVVSEICVQTLSEAGSDKKDIIRIRLSLEEILGVWLESLRDASVHVDCGQKFGRAFMKISVDGPAMDALEDNEALILSGHMLSQAGLSFVYAYNNGKNCLICNPRKKNSIGQITLLMCAVILAVVLGAAARLFPAIQAASLAVTQPLFNMILGAIRAVSSPLVFLAVCCGIISIGDLAMVGKIGRRLILKMIADIFILSAVMALLNCLLFPVTADAGNEVSGNFSKIYQMVLEIVPSDIVSPFINGNALQLVFMGICVGAALLVMGERVTAMHNALMQANEAVQFLMAALGKVIPFFVFLSLFDLMLSDFGSGLSSLVKVFVITIPGFLLLALFYVFAAAVRLKVSPILLMKKMLPTYMIALTTASSAAAFSTNLETCERKLGIPKRAMSST